MNGKNFSETQIIKALKEYEAGYKVDDICRRYSIFLPTFNSWKSKFGRMEDHEARRLIELEAENAELKKLLEKAQREKTALDNGAV
jgi:putative transposase